MTKALRWQLHLPGYFYAIGPASFDEPVTAKEAFEHFAEVYPSILDDDEAGVSVPTGERVWDDEPEDYDPPDPYCSVCGRPAGLEDSEGCCEGSHVMG